MNNEPKRLTGSHLTKEAIRAFAEEYAAGVRYNDDRTISLRDEELDHTYWTIRPYDGGVLEWANGTTETIKSLFVPTSVSKRGGGNHADSFTCCQSIDEIKEIIRETQIAVGVINPRPDLREKYRRGHYHTLLEDEANELVDAGIDFEVVQIREIPVRPHGMSAYLTIRIK